MMNIVHTPEQRTREEVQEKGRKIMGQHGLKAWEFDLDQAKGRAGACDFVRKRITVSCGYALKVPEHELIDTILHEVAHALVGGKHKHDNTWKSVAVRIGCSGKRCHSYDFTEPTVTKYCENGCWNRGLLKAPSKTQQRICTKCGGRVLWRRNNKTMTTVS